MAVVIRFSRHGAKKKPVYRVVAADKQYPRDGRFIEVLGTYHPSKKDLKVNAERVKYWLNAGAQPSATVKKVIEQNGLL